MFDLIVLILSLTLLHLYVYLGEFVFPGILKILFTLPLWIVVFKRISIQGVPEFISRNKLLFVFFFLIVIAYIRSYLADVATFNELFFGLFLLPTLILFAVSLTQNEKLGIDKLLLAFFGSIGVYNLINIGMYFLGLQTSSKRVSEMFGMALDKAVMLESIGINSDRVLFPLANGLNNFSVMCGVALVFWGMVLLKKDYSRGIKFVSLVFVISSLVGILLSDSRGALMFGVVSVVLCLIIPDNKKYFIPRLLYLLPLLVPILYFSIEYIIDTLNYYHIYILDEFSRGSSDVQQFAGRAIVWQSAFDNLSSFSLLHLVGYGWYGQTVSGVVNDYYQLALMFRNPERVTLHNSYLQYIFNIGYIGLMVFLMLYRNLFRELIATHSAVSQTLSSAVIAALLYMSLAALYETNLAMGGEESVFFVVLIFIILGKRK